LFSPPAADPIEFGSETFGIAAFCKHEPVSCVFPFKYNGVEYKKCTTEGLDQTAGTVK
jgi:hypothetical protein